MYEALQSSGKILNYMIRNLIIYLKVMHFGKSSVFFHLPGVNPYEFPSYKKIYLIWILKN